MVSTIVRGSGWSTFEARPGLDEPSERTGAVMRAGTLRDYATRAGFGDVDVLPFEPGFLRTALAYERGAHAEGSLHQALFR